MGYNAQQLQQKISDTESQIEQHEGIKAEVTADVLKYAKEIKGIDNTSDSFDSDLEGIQRKIKLASSQSEISKAALDALLPELEELKKSLVEVKKPVMPVSFPVDGSGKATIEKSEVDDLLKSFNIVKYNGVSIAPDHPVMNEIYGGDYRQVNYEQEKSFVYLLRSGGKPRVSDEKVLMRTYAPVRDVIDMLRDDISVADIKSIQVEGIAQLGGYAVPPDRNNTVIQQSAGLTMVRQAGAMVVQTQSPMVSWLRVTSTSGVYPSDLRGQWVGEATAGGEQNIKFGEIDIKANNYSYVVKFSQNILQSATNLTSIFNNETAKTLALDEDIAFLTGDGANKPRGILPGGINADGLVEVLSNEPGGLSIDGVRKLRRGIPTQYWSGSGAYVGTSATGDIIESFKDGNVRYFFPDGLEPGSRIIGTNKWFESEALDEVAVDAYPLIFGNFDGYMIVERGGLRIQRWHDSGTTATQVWFEVLRQIGGAVIKPWQFSTQKVSPNP